MRGLRAAEDVALQDLIRRPPAVLPIHSPASSRYFQFFMERTALILSDNFGEMSLQMHSSRAEIIELTELGYAYWCVMLPEVCQTQPAVRHCVFAVSALHECVGLTYKPVWANATFMSNYSKAVELIAAPEGKLSLELVLMSCSLFACGEFLLGGPVQVIAHPKSGLGILDEKKQRSGLAFAERATSLLIEQKI